MFDGGERPGGAGADEQPAPATEQRFTLPEIDRILEGMQQDPAGEVRAAVQRSRQLLAAARQEVALDRQPHMLSAIEQVIFLKQIPFFEGMTIEQLKVLATVCEEQCYTSGDYIYRQGEPGGVLCMVVAGRVGIEQEKGTGSFARVATIETHAYFGELNLFDCSPHPVSAIALQDSLILRLQREPLVALMRQNPDLPLRLIGVLSRRLRETNDRIAVLTRTRPPELEKLYTQFE